MTDAQQRFCDEYLIDLNATRAYKVAYPRCKKEETINAAASRMLRNVKVQEYISVKQKEIEKRTEITQDKVAQELAKIAFFNIKEIYKEDGKLKEIKDMNDDVARAIGNTAPVAATNYNTMSAKDEAELYHQHYDAAFAPMREQIKARYEKEENVILLSDHISPKPVMYGNCTSNDNKQCNKNNCDECPQRIVCR